MSTQSASRTLGAAATLESLKKEAKRWLKALREGDAAARERLRRALPDAGADVGLSYGWLRWCSNGIVHGQHSTISNVFIPSQPTSP